MAKVIRQRHKNWSRFLAFTVILASLCAGVQGQNNPGDYLIRRNDLDTTNVTTANLDALWDLQVASRGTSISYSAGTFTLAAGKYLVMWSERFDTSDTTNNRRVEIQGRLVIGGAASSIGAGQTFIRKEDGSAGDWQRAAIVSGAGIIDIASDGTSLLTRFYRTDTSSDAGGTVDRTPDWGGVTILALDDTWNYARYSLNAALLTADAFADVVWSFTDEQETGFSRSGADITLTNAGRYLVSYTIPITKNTGNDRTEYVTRMRLNNTTEIEGSRVSTYLRGNESTDDGVLSYIGIIDVGAGDVLSVEMDATDGAPAGDFMENGSGIQILQLPAGNETIIVESTTAAGAMNPLTLTEFAWDSTPYIDTGSFTDTSPTDSFFKVDVADDYLFFATQATDNGAVRTFSTGRFSVNDTISNYAAGGQYNRSSGADDAGYSFGSLLTGLSPSNDISLENIYIEVDHANQNLHFGAMSGLRLGSIFAAAADVSVGKTGTQTASMDIPSTDKYVGGAFVITEDTSSRNVTGITITEKGTVDALNDLSNVRLYYETSANCSAESFSGFPTPTESTFGSATTFNAVDGSASFTGSVAITTASSMCVYVALDVGSGATAGETLEIEISDPSTEVTVDGGGTVGPATAVAISGTTTLNSPDLQQVHYRWRNDDGGHVPAFNIQRGTSIIPAISATTTITAGVNYTAPASTSNAFIRITNTRFTGMGSTSGGGNQNLLDFTVRIDNPENLLTSINFTRIGTTLDTRIDWEILEYVGSAGGANEIIVRGSGDISTTGLTATGTTLTNISNSNKVAVFITGQATDNLLRDDWGEALFTSDLVANGPDWDPVFTRGRSVDTGYVSYAVVEFTGSNWRNVQRDEFQNTATAWDTTNKTNSGTRTIPTPLLDASKAFLHVQFRNAQAPATGLDDAGENVELTASLTDFTTRRKTINGEASKTLVVWVMENIQSGTYAMSVEHVAVYDGSTSGAEETAYTHTVSAVAAQGEASIMGESASEDGTGTAYPRGSANVRLTAANSVTWTVSDNGQEERRSFDVVQWPQQVTSATWATAAEDTVWTELGKNTTKRLRIEISNAANPSGSVPYRLEVSQSNPVTCDDTANTWTRVDSSTHWNMVASTFFADGEATTDVASGLTNENTFFVAGQLKESTDETSGITLSGTEFTEIEYAVAATDSAIGGATYCFRLTDAGTANTFTYTEANYGKVKLAADLLFGFRKSITIDRTKIPGTCGATVSNFPVLFSVTDANLATTANGGNVTDPEGDDIVFRALDDATCAPEFYPCALDHEIEKYVATTGELVAWVRVPVLNTNAAASDTVIYIYYGSSDIVSSSQDVSGVWDSNYEAAYHLDETVTDEASVANAHQDSTSNSNDADQNGNVDATGQMAKGQDFDGIDDNADSGIASNFATNITISAWFKSDDAGTIGDDFVAQQFASQRDAAASSRLALGINNDRVAVYWDDGADNVQEGTTVLTTVPWYYGSLTYDGSTVRLYLDGSEEGNWPESAMNAGSADSILVGSFPGNRYFDGILDEVRISDIARDACFIGGQYQNQFDPGDIGTTGKFYDVGGEETGPPTLADVTTFRAEMGSEGGVRLQWRTSNEINNLGFHVYREEGGRRVRVTPEMVAGSALFAGAGIRLTAGYSYGWWDRQGRATDRYWLEDVDLDGTRSWNGPVSPTAESQQKGSSQGGVQLLQSMMLSQLPRGEPLKTVLLTSGPQQPQAATALDLPELPQQFDLAASPAVKLEIRETGWYRVQQPELVAAGLDAGVNPKYLQLFVEGQEQALVVPGESDESFDPGDAIEFYGQGVDTTWTDAQIYWLVEGAEFGQRAPLVNPQWAAVAEPDSFPFTVEQKERTIYVASLKNGEEGNFHGPMVTATPLDQIMNVHHPDGTQDAQLEVTLQGLLSEAHQVKVLFNGVEVGVASFVGEERKTASFTVSAMDMVEGDNTITLIAEGAYLDYSFVDALALTYWHTYTADADALEFTVEGQGALGQPLTIEGFSNALVQVADVTDPLQTQLLDVVVQPEAVGYSMTVGVPGTGTRTLLALTEDQIKSPAAIVANGVSNWHEDPGAEVVMIAYGDFVASLEPLKALRESQGYSVALVAVEDLYDEFAFGAKTPWAIRDFLEKANNEWQISPGFVLLVGDASYDPRDYLALGKSDFVPTRVVELALLETASDDWFVDFDLDGLPELAMGRLPVKTVEETDAVIAKILAYEADPGGAWQQQALMVADENGQDFDFEGISSALKASLPDEFTVEEIFRSQSGASTRAELLAKLNQGLALVNYTGHGSLDVWGGDVLTSWDADDLSNGSQLPFFVTLNCLNGFFHDVWDQSLAEALIRSEQGGAIAVWASSALTSSLGQSHVAREMYRLVFDDGLSLGEAAAQAKAVVTDLDVRRSWVFFGDPLTRIGVNPAPAESSTPPEETPAPPEETPAPPEETPAPPSGGGGGGGGYYPPPEVPAEPEVPAGSSVLVANFVNGNNRFLASRVYLWNPSTSTGNVTVRVFTLEREGASTLLGTVDLGTLEASTARSIKLAEDILEPLGIALPYIDDGGNLTLEFSVDVANVKGTAQVFNRSLTMALGTYPLQTIPLSLSEDPTVLVANFTNGNNAFLASRIYLWNPSSSGGQVTARVFTLGRNGSSALLGTADLGTLEATSARNIKVAEDILAPLGIPLPYTDDAGNLTLEFTIQAAGVRGAA